MTQPLRYRISVQGQVGNGMLEWFGGMRIDADRAGADRYHTRLIGTVADQAALMGLLRRLYDYGYVIIGVECLDLTG